MINCIFCSQPCHAGEKFPNPYQIMQDEVWVCSKHPTPVKHYFMKAWKENCICDGWSDQKCCPRLIHYKTVMEIPRENKHTYLAVLQDNKLVIRDFDGILTHEVLELDKVPPNLTPENVAKKIPTYVIFS